jgi:hypothetical protein
MIQISISIITLQKKNYITYQSYSRDTSSSSHHSLIEVRSRNKIGFTTKPLSFHQYIKTSCSSQNPKPRESERQRRQVLRCPTLSQYPLLASRQSFSVDLDPHFRPSPPTQMRIQRLSYRSPTGRWYGIRSTSVIVWASQVSKLTYLASLASEGWIYSSFVSQKCPSSKFLLSRYHVI